MTDQLQQTNPNDHRYYHDDEIELIDYLLVIWKWKWLIIVGTLLCVLAAGVYGFTRPVVRMYEVSAVIEIDPRANFDPLGKIKSMIEYGMFNQQVLKALPNLQGTSLGKIKSMIEYGMFNQQVLNALPNLQGTSKPGSLAFEVNIPKGLNILDIAYKTHDPGLGKALLDSLAIQIKENYAPAIEKRRAEWEESLRERNESMKDIQHKIELMEKQFEFNVLDKRNRIKEHAQDIEALREKVNLVRNRIDLMNKTLQVAQSNSAKLAAKRAETILDSQDETGHVDVFLQASVIQQIINYPIVLREQIDLLIFKEKDFLAQILIRNNDIKKMEKDIEILKLNHESKIRVEEKKLSRLQSELKALKRDRDKFKGVAVRQPPTASLLPIKYKTKRNTLLAGVVGFILMFFLAFFIEYIKNAVKRTQKTV